MSNPNQQQHMERLRELISAASSLSFIGDRMARQCALNIDFEGPAEAPEVINECARAEVGRACTLLLGVAELELEKLLADGHSVSREAAVSGRGQLAVPCAGLECEVG